MPPRLLDIKAAAEYCSLSVSTLRNNGPKPVKIGRLRRYDIKMLDAWIDRLAGCPEQMGENAEEDKALALLELN